MKDLLTAGAFLALIVMLLLILLSSLRPKDGRTKKAAFVFVWVFGILASCCAFLSIREGDMASGNVGRALRNGCITFAVVWILQRKKLKESKTVQRGIQLLTAVLILFLSAVFFGVYLKA